MLKPNIISKIKGGLRTIKEFMDKDDMLSTLESKEVLLAYMDGVASANNDETYFCFNISTTQKTCYVEYRQKDKKYLITI